MKKLTAIVYTSNTGFTARYAKLLGEKTGLPVHSLAEGGPAKGAQVLYLGWMCAGSIKGLKKAQSRYAVKAVCPVGMASNDPDNGQIAALKGKMRDIPLFYLQGGYTPQKLTGIYKLMMGAMAKVMTKNPPKDEAEREKQDAFLHENDWVNPEQLGPVLAWLEG